MVNTGEVYAFKSNYILKEGKDIATIKDGDILEVKEIMVALDGYEYYITSVPMRIKDEIRTNTIYWISTDFDDLLKDDTLYLFDGAGVLVEEPENNDDRDTCYKCGAPTKEWVGMLGIHKVCTKCGR